MKLRLYTACLMTTVLTIFTSLPLTASDNILPLQDNEVASKKLRVATQKEIDEELYKLSSKFDETSIQRIHALLNSDDKAALPSMGAVADALGKATNCGNCKCIFELLNMKHRELRPSEEDVGSSLSFASKHNRTDVVSLILHPKPDSQRPSRAGIDGALYNAKNFNILNHLLNNSDKDLLPNQNAIDRYFRDFYFYASQEEFFQLFLQRTADEARPTCYALYYKFCDIITHHKFKADDPESTKVADLFILYGSQRLFDGQLESPYVIFGSSERFIPDKYSVTDYALLQATYKNHSEAVKYLLALKDNKQPILGAMHYALNLASEFNRGNIAQLLLSLPADRRVSQKSTDIALEMAVSKNHLDVIKSLMALPENESSPSQLKIADVMLTAVRNTQTETIFFFLKHPLVKLNTIEHVFYHMSKPEKECDDEPAKADSKQRAIEILNAFLNFSAGNSVIRQEIVDLTFQKLILSAHDSVLSAFLTKSMNSKLRPSQSIIDAAFRCALTQDVKSRERSRFNTEFKQIVFDLGLENKRRIEAIRPYVSDVSVSEDNLFINSMADKHRYSPGTEWLSRVFQQPGLSWSESVRNLCKTFNIAQLGQEDVRKIITAVIDMYVAEHDTAHLELMRIASFYDCAGDELLPLAVTFMHQFDPTRLSSWVSVYCSLSLKSYNQQQAGDVSAMRLENRVLQAFRELYIELHSLFLICLPESFESLLTQKL